ncbi:MAG TPA: GntR family transcriptional regulator [Chloroflexi bacterium]|nr:GntR family transcriptional regulator [Chloroflexota bacterium]
MASFQPIEPVRLSDIVVRQLQRMIANGELAAGERLPPERELAQQLGVSRASLREAIRLLERVGLIEVKPGAGAFVSEDSSKADGGAIWIPWLVEHREQLLELLEARELLEADVARLAASRLTGEIRDELVRVYQEWRESLAQKPLADVHALDRAFHDVIGKASGNRYLISVTKSLYEAFHDARDGVFSLKPRIRPAAVEEHEVILQALLAGDPEAAYEAMRAHIRNFRNDVANAIAQSSQRISHDGGGSSQ